jgi:hypothetical protein
MIVSRQVINRIVRFGNKEKNTNQVKKMFVGIVCKGKCTFLTSTQVSGRLTEAVEVHGVREILMR